MTDRTLEQVRDEMRAWRSHTGFESLRLLGWAGAIDAAIKQREQDAALYQELLMAVEKKFPGESRHETALRYIRETELQSCEPKCDAAMAKESDNG